MDTTIISAEWTTAATDWLIVPLFSDDAFAPAVQQLDAALGGVMTRLRADGDATGKLCSLVPIRGVTGMAAKRLLLVGVGPAAKLTAPLLERALLTAVRSLTDQPARTVSIGLPEFTGIDAAAAVRAAVYAAHIGGVGQDFHRTEPSRFALQSLTLLTDLPIPGGVLQTAEWLAEGVNLTRELVNRPPSEITPVNFAQRAVQVAQSTGLAVEVFDQPRLEAERMQSLLAVARGSAEPPRMVVLRHQGGLPEAPSIALVGKGVTFDSGGLSLKTSEGMQTMKCDMAGAATVLGAMQVIARLKLPVNVIGLMGLVENMPSGTAFKLGDVLTARNGVTIEVLNTDAEGRLVLADVLSYAVDLKVSHIVDLATLTGACVVALGEDVSGAMTNNQEWCNQLLNVAREMGEDVWQLPMHAHYDDLIKSETADIKNIGGKWGGAITAAKFLERFVGKTPWVHLDIAGPAFASSNKPYREGGGTGCLVRTLVELVRQQAR